MASREITNKDSRAQRRPRKRFLDVDVWRAKFGPVSVKAIYDVYCQKFNQEVHSKDQRSFRHCLNSLRKLDNPDYEPET